MNPLLVLKLLQMVGPALAEAPKFIDLFHEIIGTFHQKDQVTLKAAYADLIANNDEGHARLQAKLAAAAGQ